MSKETKFIILILLWCCYQESFAEDSFDSFHSNFGEIIILTPKTIKTLSSTDLRASSETKPKVVETDENKTLTDSSSATKNQSKLDENKTSLTKEEIDELLLSELLEWVEEDKETIYSKPDWYKFHTIQTGVGYSENPLGATYNPESSSFSEINLESFFLNQKNPQHEILIYLFAEGKNYYQLDEDEIAGLVLSQFDYCYKPPTISQSYGLRFQYTFFDQPMDFSSLGFPYRTKITSQKSEISPYLKWDGEEGEEGKLEMSWSKERLRQFEDQSSKFGISTSLSNKFAEPFKWNIKIYHIWAKYKDRVAKNESGNPLTGISKTKYTGINTKLTSSADNGWSKDLSLGTSVEKVNDNQGGYYNYHRLKTSLEKKFETEKWESEISLGHHRTRYSERLVNNQGKFSKDHWSLELGINREIKENWKSYAKWVHETDRSNDSDYAFDNNVWSVGITWEK